MVKNLPVNAGDAGSVPRWGGSHERENDNPLHYSCEIIPWIEESGGLKSMRSQRVGYD